MVRLDVFGGCGLAAVVLCSVVAVLAGARSAPAAAAHSRSPWPFDQPPLGVLRRSPRKVFAHYFSPFPISIDNRDPEADYYARGYLDPEGERGKHRACGGYLRQRPLPRPRRPGADWAAEDMAEEVRRAAALGLDGFAFDILSSRGVHWQRLEMLLGAARRVDPGFKIMLMPDMNAEFRREPDRLVEVVAGLASHPSVFRLGDGRLVLAPFNAHSRSVEWWKEKLSQLEARGVKTAFVPLFQGWKRYARDFAPVSHGMSDWGPRWPSGAEALRGDARRAHAHVPVWMAPVAPQDFRPKSFVYWEAAGSLAYRKMWESAIEGGADWVHLITWNDYSEASEIAPSTGTGYSFYDLTAYYVTWFKTGRPPAIVRDVLYYFHRVHATTARPDPAKQSHPFACKGGDAPRDEVELVAFLARPGELQIELAGEVHRRSATAGVTTFRVPLAAGRPVFRLLRGRRRVMELESRWEIRGETVYQDLLYRGGSSARRR